MSPVRPVVRIVCRALGALLVVALALPLGWRLVTGDTYLTVTSTSMVPTYEVGDVLVVQEPTGDDLSQVGQPVVVSFGDGDTTGVSSYIHRVVEVFPDGRATLRGDNNDSDDPNPVRQDQVIGTPRWHVGGTAATVFHASETLAGRVVLVAAAGVLLWWAPGRLADRRRAVPRHRSAEDVQPVAR